MVCKAGLREVAEGFVQKAGKVATVLGASALVAGVSSLQHLLESPCTDSAPDSAPDSVSG